jgi:hypothetical protein
MNLFLPDPRESDDMLDTLYVFHPEELISGGRPGYPGYEPRGRENCMPGRELFSIRPTELGGGLSSLDPGYGEYLCGTGESCPPPPPPPDPAPYRESWGEATLHTWGGAPLRLPEVPPGGPYCTEDMDMPGGPRDEDTYRGGITAPLECK